MSHLAGRNGLEYRGLVIISNLCKLFTEHFRGHECAKRVHVFWAQQFRFINHFMKQRPEGSDEYPMP